MSTSCLIKIINNYNLLTGVDFVVSLVDFNGARTAGGWGAWVWWVAFNGTGAALDTGILVEPGIWFNGVVADEDLNRGAL